MKLKESFNNEIDKIAGDMKSQHEDLTISTYLLIEYTADLINRYSRLYSGNKKISNTGFKVLNTIIINGGGMIPSEISKIVNRSKHSISKVVYTLENHGWVKIVPVGGDRRKKEVRITSLGLAVAKGGTIYSRVQVSEEVLGGLNKKEKKDMYDMLKRVREHTLKLIREKSS